MSYSSGSIISFIYAIYLYFVNLINYCRRGLFSANNRRRSKSKIEKDEKPYIDNHNQKSESVDISSTLTIKVGVGLKALVVR